MRIIASIHLYPPTHNCGSEWYLHNILKYLKSKGHEVKVFLHDAGKYNIRTPYSFEGIDVFGGKPVTDKYSYMWADVVLTHLDYTQYTMMMNWSVGKPTVHLVHNDIPYPSIINAPESQFVIYNSQWVADSIKYKWDSMVFTPPCDWRQYDVNENPHENEFITMINLDMNKGGHLLKQIAERMPDKKFLGVKGGYSRPTNVGQITNQPKNVTVIENTKDILSIYKKTRILLCLSLYESWGMTATEAMCNGIPVIACPTPGLKENLAYAGVWVPARKYERFADDGSVINEKEYDVSHVIKQIKKLDDIDYYEKFSGLSRQRSRELDPEQGLQKLEQFLFNVQSNYRHTISRSRWQ